MNKLPQEKQVQVIQCLVEGNSIRSTVRMTGVAKGTILKLLESVGKACEAFHNKTVTSLYSKRVQCDEIWCFCYSKEKNVPAKLKHVEGIGTVFTFSALDADSKLVINWKVGPRSLYVATTFMRNLKSRCLNRIQLTTDAWKRFPEAVEEVFGSYVDYGLSKKEYLGQDPTIPGGRYSPGKVTGVQKIRVTGSPKKDDISTSYVERQNLTMRMSMRRFTRLTNAFSKKYENLKAAIALHFVFYNFCRVHQALRATPAMQSGLTDHVWNISELLELTNSDKVANSVISSGSNQSDSSN
jgi:IS1 family transposase